MGKRVEGKAKKKGVKAKLTSMVSSKRKLSRFGKKSKKGKIGSVTDYMTRSQAMRKLQITLKDFRRLCILKGIYPRTPKTAPKGKDKVYYHIKDISYLSHEPLLQKFRDFKTFMRRVRKAAGRRDIDEARRIHALKPEMKVDHLVKERYPRFVDALRDLDDCLSMIHLFAALPSEKRITSDAINMCKRLVREWDYYVAKSKTLRKVFVSVKGVYYQAEVMGEPITWLAPHPFRQYIPAEVDIRVMMTFLEFYQVFLRFTLFKLYHHIGVLYPPQFDAQLDSAGAFLSAVRVQGVNAGGESTSESSSGAESASMIVHASASSSSSSSSSSKGASEGLSPAEAKALQEQKKETKKRVSSLQAKLAKMAEGKGDKDSDDEDDEDDDEHVDIAAPLQAAFDSMAKSSTSSSSSSVGSARGFNGSGLGLDDLDTEQTEEETRKFADASGASSSAQSGEKLGRLFRGLRFFINREVNLNLMELLVFSCGGAVGWEGVGSPYSKDDAAITHEVVDRPVTEDMKKVMDSKKGHRDYVQPQWILDSINNRILLPVNKYAPGTPLPPHLSPFVVDDKEGYTPAYRTELNAMIESASVSNGVGGAGGKRITLAGEEDEAAAAAAAPGDDDEDEENYAQNLAKEKQGVSFSKAKQGGEEAEEEEEESEDEEEEEGSDDEDDEDDEDEDSDEDEEDDEEEEEAEATSTATSKGPRGVVYAPKEVKKTETEENKELALQMMSKKTKRLYSNMQYGITKKKEATQALMNKRLAAEEDKAPKKEEKRVEKVKTPPTKDDGAAKKKQRKA